MFTREITPDWLASFLHRERNSLHYDPKKPNEFVNGYVTAVDGIGARLYRELREVPGFDGSRFLAILDGRIDPNKTAEGES